MEMDAKAKSQGRQQEILTGIARVRIKKNRAFSMARPV
jgi:hypothetical protein